MLQDLDPEDLKKMRSDFLENDKYRNTQNAVMENGIKKSITNKSVIESHPFVFSIDVDSDDVMNQKHSGRCWMFSAMNFIRHHVEKEHHMKNFELSTDYMFFYDKLERANYFYHNVIDTADQPLSDRKVNWLMHTPQQDGGDWSLLVSLMEKYGVVPASVMGETAVSANTTELNFAFNRKLQKDAMKLRNLVNSDASDEKLASELRRMNSENYKILAISFGTPPEKFNFSYRDENNQYHTIGEVTPLEFFKKFVDINLNDYVELMNIPGLGYKYNQVYTIQLSKNMVDGIENRYLNVSMDEMNKLMLEQLKDGTPVWFGCDVLQEYNRPTGSLELGLYDWKRSFGFSLGKDKAERFEYGESLPTHAMLICGVELHDNKPINWKIQNSWGNKVGHLGYFMMGEKWMNAYTYEIVINKKYLSDQQLSAYDKEPIELPYYNAFNPI
ncbi:C1 family peptidase [Lactobacillus hominis]|uniref:Aminopeptidase n=1 Tax=Lactobacillus hominis DSM 23910 = CRBIP 24.179 TaxID=1423758 RepID=I7L9W0_9LACO|nr:C1 family peptidase [Lactobacillus hominis]KRM84320.1 aminopeptidase C [Lactobacillus hominis DSM 23910 = CRBIP 24.179]MCT3348211.1 peptidase C1 [Lactobacillus hominis]CCI81724.1 Bleomycin hydrolase [Lactobacillus hominis DSM 23910 = CRBIP 24.179]